MGVPHKTGNNARQGNRFVPGNSIGNSNTILIAQHKVSYGTRYLVTNT